MAGMLLMAADAVALPQFVDVTDAALPGLNEPATPFGDPPFYTGGAAIADCDGDGWLDLFLAADGDSVLYRNRGDGTFENISAPAGFRALYGSARGAAFGDIDNDGDPDLVASGYFDGRHFLWVNDGDCTFREDGLARGVATFSGAIGRSVSMADYDRDGFLDIYVAELQSPIVNPEVTGLVSHLFRNRGASAPGTFDDVTVAAGLVLDPLLGTQEGTHPFTARFSDLDADGWPDLALAGDFGKSRLFWNAGDGTFVDGTTAAGVGTDEHGMGSTTADLDGDGRLDLFVTSIFIDGHPLGTGNRLYRYDGARTFADVTGQAGVRDGMWGWGAQAFDADNDGDLDLIQANGVRYSEGVALYVQEEFGPVDIMPFETDPLRFWINDGHGGFSERSALTGLVDTAVTQGVLPFDYDGDGDLDVLVTGDDTIPPRLLRNQGPSGGWIALEFVGQASNRGGIGALVSATLPGGERPLVREVSASSTYLAQDGSGRVHLGIGEATAVASLRVRWPSGAVSTHSDLAAGERHLLRETDACLPPADCEHASPTPTTSATATPAASATATASATSTATASATPTGTASATPTSTASATPAAPCVGDCNDDGAVTIDELLLLVGAALGLDRGERCPRTGSTVTIALLVDAVARSPAARTAEPPPRRTRHSTANSSEPSRRRRAPHTAR